MIATPGKGFSEMGMVRHFFMEIESIQSLEKPVRLFSTKLIWIVFWEQNREDYSFLLRIAVKITVLTALDVNGCRTV